MYFKRIKTFHNHILILFAIYLHWERDVCNIFFNIF